MKAIAQVVVIVFVALGLESQAWKYEYAGIFALPLVVICLFGIWLIIGGGISSQDRTKACGRILLGLGAFGVGAVIHTNYYDWDRVIGEIFFPVQFFACVVVLAALVIFLMCRNSSRNLQRRRVFSSLSASNRRAHDISANSPSRS